MKQNKIIFKKKLYLEVVFDVVYSDFLFTFKTKFKRTECLLLSTACAGDKKRFLGKKKYFYDFFCIKMKMVKIFSRFDHIYGGLTLKNWNGFKENL